MVNNHFVNDSLLSLQVGQVVVGARDCLVAFYWVSRAMVSDHKTNY